ncbi:uncharacterized protein LOC132704930 [Cylas formicarius]|uniref:uncharacterized protein LOC132704930 n=1 Tax=Cylas formicarius TaxID=197179 RepID=UPI002958C769|nr:uncharacterized protein LOC132704930 [Cylas formicarius]
MRNLIFLCYLHYAIGGIKTNLPSTIPRIMEENGKPLSAKTLNLAKTVGTASLPASKDILLDRHMGREHELDTPPINRVKTSEINTTQNNSLSGVKQDKMELSSKVQKDDAKTSVPKKGVTMPDQPDFSNSIHQSAANKTNVTNIPIKPHKKPLVTESDASMEVSKEDNIKNSLQVEQIDPVLLHQKSQESEYIVPIVAVILSVPLVAILISVLYKRGMDWWLHRNYKRMDFLIEGMYQT